MSLTLNNAQELLLSKFSYLDFATSVQDFRDNYKGKTLGQVAENLLRPDNLWLGSDELNLKKRLPGGLNETQFRSALEAIAADDTLKDLTLTNYVNNNGLLRSGYVGYALSSPDNSTCLILSRGSESDPVKGFTSEDWIMTNILGIGVIGSASAFGDAVKFAEDSSKGYAQKLAVGHSLGGALTLYIAAKVEGFVNNAHAYDAPGIAHMLSSGELERLEGSDSEERRSLNFVANSDFVGPIRYIEDITVFVETNPNQFYSGSEIASGKWWGGHCLDAFNLENNNVVETSSRTFISNASEVVLGGVSWSLNLPFLSAKRVKEMGVAAINYIKNLVADGSVDIQTNPEGSVTKTITDSAGDIQYTATINPDSSWKSISYSDGHVSTTMEISADRSYTETCQEYCEDIISEETITKISADEKTKIQNNSFDAQGRLISSSIVTEDSLGKITGINSCTYIYTANGLKLLKSKSAVDAAGHTTTINNTYDATGNLLSTYTTQTDAHGNATINTMEKQAYTLNNYIFSNINTQNTNGDIITTGNRYLSDGSSKLTDTLQTEGGSADMSYQKNYSWDVPTVDTYDTATGKFDVDFNLTKYNIHTGMSVTPIAGGGYLETWDTYTLKTVDGQQVVVQHHGTGNTAANVYIEDGEDASLRVTTTTSPNGDRAIYNYVSGDGRIVAYETNGGLDQTWNFYYDWRTGYRGENNTSDDGSTFIATNGNGVTTIKTYDAATGITKDIFIPDGIASYDYFNENMSVDFQEVWSSTDGSHGELNHLADGSYTRFTDYADGNAIDEIKETYDATTGLYEKYCVYANGTYSVDIDNPLAGFYVDTAYDGQGGYQETWSSTIDNSWGENNKSVDGSYTIITHDADGTSVEKTYNASTGITSDTSYDGQGGYQQTWTAKNGSYGENDKSGDGNIASYTFYRDGSYRVTKTDSQGGGSPTTTSAAATDDRDGIYSASAAISDENSFTWTYDAATDVYGYHVAQSGVSTDYSTTYYSDESYRQVWSSNTGSSGESYMSEDGRILYNETYNADGGMSTDMTIYDGSIDYQQDWISYTGDTGVNSSSDDEKTVNSITVNPDGTTIVSTTIYDDFGGYQQKWRSSDGSWGENDKSADGSTITIKNNLDGTYSVDSYNASAADSYPGTITTTDTDFNGRALESTVTVAPENGGGSPVFMAAVGDYIIMEEETNDSMTITGTTTFNGHGGHHKIWTATDGRYGEYDKLENGNYTSVVYYPDGYSITETYDAATGVDGFHVANDDGSWVDYTEAFDGKGGYVKHWTASDGTYGDYSTSADGSYATTTNYPDGSSITDSFSAATNMYGYREVNTDGSWTDTTTIYNDTGGYHQHWTASDGSNGEYDLADNGNTLRITNNPDGTSIKNTFDASTSLTVVTTYNGRGGYHEDWTASNGTSGENIMSDDGLTLISTTNNPYGYNTTSTTIYDGNGGYQKSWSSSDGSSGENDMSADGSTLNATTYADGRSVTLTYNALSGVYGQHEVFPDGKWRDINKTYDADGGEHTTWTRSDGSYGVDHSDGLYAQTIYNGNGGYQQTWNDRHGNDGSNLLSDDGLVLTSTDGSITSTTTFNGNGGYHQEWSSDYGMSGVNDMADDGITLTGTTIFGDNVADQGEIWTSYDSTVTSTTIYNVNGGNQQNWTSSNGSYGENVMADDGSTLTSTTHNVDGNVVTSVTTFDEGNGVYHLQPAFLPLWNPPGGNACAMIDQVSYHNYSALYDSLGKGFHQSWTSSDGSYGENNKYADGSSLSTIYNPDGSYEISTFKNATDSAERFFTDTIYNGQGGYQQTWFDFKENSLGTKVMSDDGLILRSTVYSDRVLKGDYIERVTVTTSTTTNDGHGGSVENWSSNINYYAENSLAYDDYYENINNISAIRSISGQSGENIRYADGSTENITNDPGGNFTTTNTYDAATGVTTYYIKYYESGGYKESWTASDGTSGENDVSSDGSSLKITTNLDGTSIKENYIASTGVSSTTIFDGYGGYKETWTETDGHSGENENSDNGSTTNITHNPDGTTIKSTFDALTGLSVITIYNGNGGYHENWTASDGTSGKNIMSDDGTTLTSTKIVAGGVTISSTTTYDGNGGYHEDWTSSDGTSGENIMSDDGNTLTSTKTTNAGITISSTTTYDENGGYQELWTSSDGSSGENDKSSDGSTKNITNSADGTSNSVIYDASTGITTTSTTTHDDNGGYTTIWTSSNGQSGEDDKTGDGSTVSITNKPDGSSATNTYDASTGIYGYSIVNADGSHIDATRSPDGSSTTILHNPLTGVSITYVNNADGSWTNTKINTDGSSIESAYDASTGVYGYNVGNADGSWIDYDTTYDDAGGYQQSWTMSNGSSGENDRFDNGNTATIVNNPDGSSTTSTYDASTGVYGYNVENTDGSWKDYTTIYDATGNYVQNWIASNGLTGEKEKWADGNVTTCTYGTTGNDYIEGYQGNETIAGGEGDDTIIGYEGNDTLYGGIGHDTIYGGAGDDYIDAGDGNNFVSEGDGGGNNTIYTGSGDDYIEGGEGDDYINAGDGNNFIGDMYGDSIIYAGSGNDTIDACEDPDHVDFINAGDGNNAVYAYAGNDTIYTGSGNDTISGGDGNDYIEGGAGNDTYLFNIGDGVDTIKDTSTIAGGNVIVFSEGIKVNDLSFTEDSGVLTLHVGTNGDAINLLNFDKTETNGSLVVRTLQFNNGSQVNLVDLINRPPVVANPIANQATMEDATFSFSVPANTFSDPDAGDTLSYSAKLSDGSALPSWLAFNAATMTFSGTPLGVGTLSINVTATDSCSASVSSTFNLDVQTSVIMGTANNDNLVGTIHNNIMYGLEGKDTLTGGAGDDTLDGGAGADKLLGGTGNDVYIVDNTGDVVIENANEGADAIQSSVTYTLGSNVENLTLTGTSAINGTGNTLKNVIIGNSANNVLNGGTGADIMTGGTGNDTYYVDNTGDVVIEKANEGTDSVRSSVTYTLSDNVENITLTGTEAIDGTGNALDNRLYGNAAANILSGDAGNDYLSGGDGDDQLTGGEGNDTLLGGTGADIMTGGTGNDTYYVDNTGDVVIENANEGTDSISSSVTYTLGDNIENMTLTGTNAIDGTGNGLDNRLYGNAAANTLSGDAGNDYLSGGDGDDQLLGGEGNDTLLGGRGSDSLIGGAGSNYLNGGDGDDQLIGGEGNDTLAGGTGADTMLGGAGDDTYYVDNIGDVVIENPEEGTDTVRSPVSYMLGDNLENLMLTGTDAINGTGNALDNRIYGNAAANVLSGDGGNDYLRGGEGDDQLVGDDGNDTLAGGAGADILTGGVGNDYLNGGEGDDKFLGGDGNDTLIGGTGVDTMLGGAGDDVITGGNGSDQYLFGNSDGKDRINETISESSDIDTLKLIDAATNEPPVIVKQGNDLYVFVDSTNYMRIASEFQQTNYGIERLEVSDGHYITRGDIQTIVDTMSAINDSGMDVIQKYNAMMESEQYQNILGASWQQ